MKTYCPYCKKDVEYEVEKRDVNSFKGIEIKTYENVAVCKVCNKDLYVNNLENENTKRICNEYRKVANIVNSDDIVKLREKYNLSQRELTSILGFGKMTINRYERGELPTKSQSDYLKLLIGNNDKFLEKVNEAYKNNQISERTYKKVVDGKNEKEILEEELRENIKNYINYSLCEKPNIFNGYKTFDLEKTENIISYIASKVKNLTITSMNKYLWYIDMISFNLRTVSITGLTYQKQQFGPTIIDKKYNELSLLSDKYTREDLETIYGNTTKIISNNNYNLDLISDEEKEIIDKVINNLKNKSVDEISKLSHKEDGWKDTKKFDKISFEYAMKLKTM